MLVSGTGWEQGPQGPCYSPHRPCHAPALPNLPFLGNPSPPPLCPRVLPCAPVPPPAGVPGPRLSPTPAPPEEAPRTRPRTSAQALIFCQFCVSTLRLRTAAPGAPPPRTPGPGCAQHMLKTRAGVHVHLQWGSNGHIYGSLDVFVKRRPPVCGLRQVGRDFASDFGEGTRHEEGSPGPGATGPCRPDLHLHAPWPHGCKARSASSGSGDSPHVCGGTSGPERERLLGVGAASSSGGEARATSTRALHLRAACSDQQDRHPT